MEIHWCEKSVVRLGPNLTLFELCAVSASKLKVSRILHVEVILLLLARELIIYAQNIFQQSIGLHRLCGNANMFQSYMHT